MRVIFPTYGGGHVKSIIPVVSQMKSIGWEPIVIGFTSSVLELGKANVEYLELSSFLSLYTFDEISTILSLGNKYSSISNASLKRLEIVSYVGINLFDLLLRYDRQKVLNSYRDNGRDIFLPNDFARRVLKNLKPDAVFVSCGQRAERAFALEALRNNIEVFRLVDLLGENISLENKINVFVMNEKALKNVKESNNLISNVIVTGNPNFEFEPICSSDQSEFDNLVAKHEFVVTIFTQPSVAFLSKTIELIYEEFRNNEGFLFLIKIHPNECMSQYEKFICDNFKVMSDIDANKVVYNSDVNLTFFSSVGFQAVNLSKPLGVLNLFNVDYPVDYVSYGIADLISSIDDLYDLIKRTKEGVFFTSKREANYLEYAQPKNSVNNILAAMSNVFLNGA
ncbi:hypothetical protein [Shewanella algae]|uniref:hypothetical protein n=1 Tax=Shewanella algae TaxID=38313 RepID=UPI000BB62693|nr:hypothetical protein [Shewanella algae]PBQ28614.1 hypothetical protein AYI97_06155 [Shewanella algae]